MGNFACEECGKHIIDSPRGYITGCKHYPLSGKNKVKSAWAETYHLNLSKGYDHGYAAYMADQYCDKRSNT